MGNKSSSINEVNNLNEEIYNCTKCSHLGLGKDLKNGIIPIAGEGNPKNPLWIIGLNPQIEKKLTEARSESFERYQDIQLTYFDHEDNIHEVYFKKFKHILGIEWRKIFEELVFNTDLVKCPSRKWTKKQKKAKNTCSKYLKHQLETFKPQLILCNGASVSNWFEKNYGITKNEYDTCGFFKLDNQAIWIVFSGFIGQMDNYSKRRIRRDVIEVISQNDLDIKRVI